MAEEAILFLSRELRRSYSMPFANAYGSLGRTRIPVRRWRIMYGGFSMVVFAISLIFGFMTLDYYRYGAVVTNLALISVSSGIIAFLAFFKGIILCSLISVVRETRWSAYAFKVGL